MKEQNITVALRVRPINSREVRAGAKPIARAVDQNLVVLMDPNRDSDDVLRAKRSHDHRYMFDVAFGPRVTQNEVYQRTSQGLVSKVISGYNATVFAYGATGAGKTYTMLGRAREPGIMALTLSDLFAKMEENKEHSQYHVTMAYLEIYNETVRNLLGPSSAGLLDLREDAHGATIVSGLTELEVKDSEEVMTLLHRGNLRRTCEPTAVNKTSSRSHAILKVTVEEHSRVMNISQKVRTGVLFMIDLAGSERAANTQNRGQRMKEGAHINRSLLALANCINTLVSGGQYVNYRDSKLTRLLKDALSGNFYTVMIAHISPASSCFEESKNTLKYADRVKHLKTKVSSNITEVDHHITKYRQCVENLKERIAELESQREMEWRKGEGEGEALCAELKALLHKEKDIRQEMVLLEHRLLQIAVEKQKYVATIQEGSASSSPLPTSTLSPLPTTLEDTGQPSLLFERCFAGSSLTLHHTLSISDLNIPSEDTHDSHMTAMETTHWDHMTTTQDSHMTTTTDSHMTTTEGAHDSHVITTESSHGNHMMPSDQLTSPDSGFPAAVHERRREGDDGEEGDGVRGGDDGEEGDGVREGLVVLLRDKRRTEARHWRLGRKLMETRTKKSQLQEQISSAILRPHQKELCEVLQLCSDLEEEGRQRELVGARVSLQLERREASLEAAMELNHQLVTALTQYRVLLEERAVSPPATLPPLQPLVSHHTSLTRQVAREKNLPVSGRGLQLPTFAGLSARLCAGATTAMAGSKSNLLVEDVTTDGEGDQEEEDGEGEEEEEEEAKLSANSTLDISDVPLPSLPISSLPQDSSLHLPLPSLPSLPPLPHTTSLITPLTTHTSRDTVYPNPSLPLLSGSNRTFPNSIIRRPFNHSKQSPPSKVKTPSEAEALPLSSKRPSARVILSKVAPRNSVSRSSSHKNKYVYNPLVEEGDEIVVVQDNDTLTPMTSLDSTRLQTQSTHPELHSLSNELNTSTSAVASPPTKSMPAVRVTSPVEVKEGGKGGGKEGGKDMQLQSVSQLSLSMSTPVRGRREVREAGKKMQSRFPYSSLPAVKTTYQKKRETLPIRAIRKPPHSMPVLPKRKVKGRQPLIPSKVTAGMNQAVASPYLKSTSKCKSGVKQAAPKKASSTHPLPKLGKSPYHIPMARTNKNKK